MTAYPVADGDVLTPQLEDCIDFRDRCPDLFQDLVDCVRAFQNQYNNALAVVERLPLDDLPLLVDSLFPENVDTVADLRALALEAVAVATSPKELLDALITRITQVDVPPSPEYVRIMSLHKSKGLTSPVVFVVGMVDGIVPTLPTPDRATEAQISAAVEERRRLLYVAITRSSSQPRHAAGGAGTSHSSPNELSLDGL
jgi:superfamily I DNA/RNA helicase